jgi:type IX secretion system PorP/SprF family membrane protein
MRTTIRICLCGLLMLSFSAKAQQQATYAQYMFNGLAINPAYAGSHHAMDVSMLSRFQNVGLDGAPNTQSLAVHSPLINQRMAVGFLAVHDKISVINQTGINAIYAYRIPFLNKTTLSLGAQIGFSAYRADYSRLEIYNPDVAFSTDLRQSRPNIGAGIFYSGDLFYVGVSMPHMVNNVFQRGSDFQTVYQTIPLIVTGGYIFSANRLIKIKPNVLLKVADNRPVELDLNCNVLFDDVLWAGLSYKFNNAITMLFELQLTQQLRFGYSYSVTMGPIKQAELGSHELLLNYRFNFRAKGVVTPRYF